MNSHDRILDWCRSVAGKRAVNGTPGMRLVDKRCRVIDLERTREDPGDWLGHVPIVYADGATWEDCETQLRDKGFMP
jgi:hypothetical protein